MPTGMLAGLAVAAVGGLAWLVAWLVLGMRHSTAGRVLAGVVLGAVPVLGLAAATTAVIEVPVGWGILLAGGSAMAVDQVGAVLVAPGVEELAKLGGVVAVSAALGRWRRLEPVECLVVAGAVALGFAIAENLLYVLTLGPQGGPSWPVELAVLRTVLSTSGHVVYALVAAGGLVGLWWEAASRWQVVLSMTVAAGLHGLFNALVVDELGLVLSAGVVLCGAVVAVVTWRQASALGRAIDEQGPWVAWPAPDARHRVAPAVAPADGGS